MVLVLRWDSSCIVVERRWPKSTSRGELVREAVRKQGRAARAVRIDAMGKKGSLLRLSGFIMDSIASWRGVTMRPFYLAGLVIALVLGTMVPNGRADQVKPPPFSGYTKYAWYRSHYEVNGDGTDVETHEWALKVLSEQGITEANQGSVDYSGSLQDAEILSAYTLKADGRRINVPAANFQEQINKGKGEASRMFSDARTKTGAFPDARA